MSCAAYTYIVPLQEHQRFPSVLAEQLLSALRQAQLRIPDLLALHLAAASSNRLHHVSHTRRLILDLVL